MATTLGYHYVKSCYGLWLPGDDRGSWSEAWDEQIGFTEPHTLHPGDPVRCRMAEERMKHPKVRLSLEMVDAVVNAIAECIAHSAGGLAIVAAAIERRARIPSSCKAATSGRGGALLGSLLLSIVTAPTATIGRGFTGAL